jgi:hypothetical protein
MLLLLGPQTCFRHRGRTRLRVEGSSCPPGHPGQRMTEGDESMLVDSKDTLIAKVRGSFRARIL